MSSLYLFNNFIDYVYKDVAIRIITQFYISSKNKIYICNEQIHSVPIVNGSLSDVYVLHTTDGHEIDNGLTEKTPPR